MRGGKINLFSLDMLLNMATAAGMSPVLKLTKPKAVPIKACPKQDRLPLHDPFGGIKFP